jgi:hypothetical protein
MTGQGANDSMISQLIAATNGNNEVYKEANKLWQAEYDWKCDQDDVKKDRTKNLHMSIRTMIKNASAIEHNKPEEICTDFLAFYNFKSHGRLIIQLHQRFEDVGFGVVVFAKGVSTKNLAGNHIQSAQVCPGTLLFFLLQQKCRL